MKPTFFARSSSRAAPRPLARARGPPGAPRSRGAVEADRLHGVIEGVLVVGHVGTDRQVEGGHAGGARVFRGRAPWKGSLGLAFGSNRLIDAAAAVDHDGVVVGLRASRVGARGRRGGGVGGGGAGGGAAAGEGESGGVKRARARRVRGEGGVMSASPRSRPASSRPCGGARRTRSGRDRRPSNFEAHVDLAELRSHTAPRGTRRPCTRKCRRRSRPRREVERHAEDESPSRPACVAVVVGAVADHATGFFHATVLERGDGLPDQRVHSLDSLVRRGSGSAAR